MPSATSPGRPWASTCRRKTAAKPMSLPTAVTTEGSVVRAIAESARALALEAAHELGHEVLRVGGGAAVAEGEHAPAGEQALAPCAAPTSSRRGALAAKKRSLRATLSATIRRMSSAFIGARPLCARPRGAPTPGTKPRWSGLAARGRACDPRLARVVADAAQVDGQQDGGHGGVVGPHLEDGAVAQPGGDVHGHRAAGGPPCPRPGSGRSRRRSRPCPRSRRRSR